MGGQMQVKLALLKSGEGETKKRQRKIACGCINFISEKAQKNVDKLICSNRHMLALVPNPRRLKETTKTKHRNKHIQSKALNMKQILSAMIPECNENRQLGMQIFSRLLEKQYKCQVFHH